MELQFADGTKPGQLVVIPEGDLDLYSSVNFCNAVAQKMDAGSHWVVLDFAKIQYMDSSGVGALIRLIQKAKSIKGEIKVAGLNGTPKKVLEMSNITSLFKSFPDTPTALKSWG